MNTLTCFKAYDVRGRLGVDLDEAIAYRIARGFARAQAAQRVVLGRDVRASSEALAAAVAAGLMDEGCEVLDLGLSGTEEMHFATSHFGTDGGICVTASHNPMDYNGMKMVRAGSAPLDTAGDGAGGLARVKALAEADDFGPALSGQRRDIALEARAAYVDCVLGFVDIAALKPLKIVVNAGHGAAGPTFDAIAVALAAKGAPLEFVRMHHTPDGSFPHGIPNPMLPENQPKTAARVVQERADMAVAWDGDFDRCFFFDHDGTYVDGEYVIGLLAEVFLAHEPGAMIIHDPRVVWNTRDVVARAGGTTSMAPTGHAFLKQAMRDTGAVYGGEMSAHHYFRDFVYCDSGMIPMLVMAELVSRKGALADLLAERRAAFPSSGEINFRLDDPKAAIARVEAAYLPHAVSEDRTDGLSLVMGGAMGDWRLNLRCSNTEPLVRLNVEARGDADLVARKVAEVKAVLLGP